MAEIPFLNIEHGKDVKAWDQQTDETSLTYTYFRFYLELGPQRSIQEAQRVMLSDDAIKRTPEVNSLRQYFTRHRWQYRADLYDRYELATKERDKAERRREELRIGLEEYQDFQAKMGRGLSALAAKVLQKTSSAIERSTDTEWDIDKASRFMSILNTTAVTASNLWSDSLGVERLNAALQDMDAKASEEVASLDEDLEDTE